MKKSILFTAVIIVTFFSEFSTAQPDTLKTQPDSLKAGKRNYLICYFETGFGISTRGANFFIEAAAGSSNGLGGSLNIMGGYVRVPGVPDDYTSLFRWFKPTDNFTAVSPALTLKYTNPKQTFRIGFEAGPSFMKWNIVQIELNPDWPDLGEFKYNKIESQERTTGCYLGLKAEIPAVQYLGCSFTLFGIINNIEPVIGFDISITLGQVKKKLD